MDEATRYFVYSYCETVSVLNNKPRVIPTETTCGFHRKHAWFKNEAFVFMGDLTAFTDRFSRNQNLPWDNPLS
jgi:hypothetical protein